MKGYKWGDEVLLFIVKEFMKVGKEYIVVWMSEDLFVLVFY